MNATAQAGLLLPAMSSKEVRQDPYRESDAYTNGSVAAQDLHSGRTSWRCPRHYEGTDKVSSEPEFAFKANLIAIDPITTVFDITYRGEAQFTTMGKLHLQPRS